VSVPHHRRLFSKNCQTIIDEKEVFQNIVNTVSINPIKYDEGNFINISLCNELKEQNEFLRSENLKLIKDKESSSNNQENDTLITDLKIKNSFLIKEIDGLKSNNFIKFNTDQDNIKFEDKHLKDSFINANENLLKDIDKTYINVINDKNDTKKAIISYTLLLE